MKKPFCSILVLLGALLVLSSAVSAQIRLDVLTGDDPMDRFGRSVTGSQTSLCVGAPGDGIIGLANVGAVHVFDWSIGSGATRVSFFPWVGSETGGQFGHSLAGDDLGDLCVGENLKDTVNGANSGQASIVDARTGAFAMSGGMLGVRGGDEAGGDVAWAGDVDGDGASDWIVRSTRGHRTSGVCSNCTGGRVLYRVSNSGSPIIGSIRGGSAFNCGCGQPSNLGWALGGVGDISGDGLDDIVLGASNGNQTRIYSWDTASSSFVLFRADGASAFPRSIAGLGDLNNDAIADFARALDGNRVEIIDGATGTLIGAAIVLAAPFAGNTGIVVANVGDQDGDGRDDLAIGARETDNNAGAVLVFGSVSRDLLGVMRHKEGGATFGTSVGSVDDLTGDGRREILIGAPNASPGGMNMAGEASLWSFDPGAVTNLGGGGVPTGCSTSVPTFGMPLGPKVPGEAFSIAASGTQVGVPAFLFLSYAPPASLPLCAVLPSMCGLTLHAAPGAVASFTGAATSVTQSATDGRGFVELRFTWPTMMPANTPLWAQYYVVCPGPSPVPGAVTDGWRF